MPEEDDKQPEQISRDLTARIVAAYVGGNKLSATEIPEVISAVYRALSEISKPPEPVVERTPAVPIRRSVGPDFVVCLECGARAKTLKRHLGSRHGLSIDEYRSRWHLKSDHPMVAPSYSETRSTMARKIGFGRKRGSKAEAVTPSTPKPGKRTRKKATASE